MSSKFLEKIGLSVSALTGILLAASMLVPRAQGDEWNKMTLLTVDQPTQVGNTYLDPGTYMLILANSESDRHIVEIFNKDRSHLINTILAIPSYRIQPTGNTVITFWETPPGTAKAVRDWFYPGDYYGEEFRYPTELRQIAQVTPPVTPAPQPPPTQESAVTPPPAPPPAAEPEPPAPQALEQAPPPEQPPVEIAQNAPPPEPAPAPAAQTEEQPLPKTASPYPLIGLSGLVALGLYAVLRRSSIV
jgi:hypothetical protein